MALSAKAVKALEMANYALPVLYATDYFTEDEWVQVDGLIHKGKYVWTQGPAPRHLLDGSPLLMSADKRERISTATVQVNESLDLTHASSSTSVQQLPSPPESRSTGLAVSVHAPKENPALLVDFSSGVTSIRSEASPAPSQQVSQSTVSAAKSPDPLTQENLKTIAQRPPNIAQLTEEFRKRNGREPRSIQEIYQPRNPQHWSHKSVAASVKTAKSVAPAPTPAPAPSHVPAPQSIKSSRGHNPLVVASGTMLVALRTIEVPKKMSPKISIRIGDTFKYDKHVSGVMHIGTNLRTNERGQVSEDAFKNPQGQYIDAFVKEDIVQKREPRKTRNTSMSSADLRAGIDSMVELNAADWNAQSDNEEESVISELPEGKKRTWAEEMNSIVEERETPPDMMKAVINGVSEMFDEKFQKYMKEKEGNTSSVPPPEKLHQSSRTPWALNANPTTPPAEKPKKTSTCWFWQYKTCRYTAEECYDLHELTDAVPVLKNGRPTWGDVASANGSAPTPTSPLLPSSIKPPVVPDPKGRRFICHFWANGHCTHSADECKFLHSDTGEGIAMHPNIAARRNPANWGSKSGLQSSVWNDVPDEGTNAKDKMLWRDIPKTDANKENDAGPKNRFSLLQDEAQNSPEIGDSWTPVYDDVYRTPEAVATNTHQTGYSEWGQEQRVDEEQPPGFW